MELHKGVRTIRYWCRTVEIQGVYSLPEAIGIGMLLLIIQAWRPGMVITGSNLAVENT